MRVRVRDVSVAIGPAEIVRGVDLHVLPGETVGVLGPNGSGKSTLLRTVYRALRPTSGVVLVDDDDAWALSTREVARRVAAVTQHSTDELRLSVREVVLMGRTPHQRPLARVSRSDRDAVDRALEQVGMTEAAGRGYTTLSGGERQRIVLARALAQQAEVLVLDEPTNHLDIAHQFEFLELVRGLRITTLVVLHDLNLAATYCDRLYLLADGRVVAAGAVADVLTPETVHEVFGVTAHLGTHPVTGALQLWLSPLDADRQKGDHVRTSAVP